MSVSRLVIRVVATVKPVRQGRTITPAKERTRTAHSPVTTSSAAADSVVGLDEDLVASRSLFLGVQSVLACHPLR